MWRKPETWGQDGGEMLLRDARSVCLVAQSCPTLCDPMDCSPLGFSVHGIFQARIPLWVATAFSRVTSWPRDWTCISCTGRQILYKLTTREAQVQNPVLSFTIGRTGENYLHTAGLRKKILIVFLSKSCCEGLNRNHSSSLAWKIPWTEKCGRLQSMGSQRVRHD